MTNQEKTEVTSHLNKCSKVELVEQSSKIGLHFEEHRDALNAWLDFWLAEASGIQCMVRIKEKDNLAGLEFDVFGNFFTTDEIVSMEELKTFKDSLTDNRFEILFASKIGLVKPNNAYDRLIGQFVD